MKNILRLSGLLGVILFVCQVQAGSASSLDLLKPENFEKLTIQQKVVVVTELRYALYEISMAKGGTGDFAAIEKLRHSPLMDLMIPSADAGPAANPANVCVQMGWLKQKIGGACTPPPTCATGGFQCNPTFYGDGVCGSDPRVDAMAATQSCQDKVKDVGTDNLVKYLRDPKNQKKIQQDFGQFNETCINSSMTGSLACSTIKNRLDIAQVALRAHSVKGHPVGPRDVNFDVSPLNTSVRPLDVGAPNLQDPALAAGTAAAAPAPATRAATEAVDYKAMREEIAKESKSLKQCNQWKLSEEIAPHSMEPMLMTFEQAQQLTCEHKNLSEREWGDIYGRLQSKLNKIAYKTKNGWECRPKRSSEEQTECDLLIGTRAEPGLARNLELCKAELLSQPVDEKWATAARTDPAVLVHACPGKSCPYLSADAYNNASGIAPVEMYFRGGFKDMRKAKGDSQTDPKQGNRLIINGKYVSRELRTYQISICDVHRDEGVKPPQERMATVSSRPARATGTDRGDELSIGKRTVQSVGEPKQIDGPKWSAPSLPQGAPATGGRPTSGQGQ